MTTVYNIDDVTNGVNGYGLQFSDQNFTATLKAATDTTLAVPLTAAVGVPSDTTNRFMAVMQYARATPADPVYVALNATAAVPAGNTFASSTSIMEPAARRVNAGDTLHFICAGVADVSVTFYAVQN